MKRKTCNLCKALIPGETSMCKLGYKISDVITTVITTEMHIRKPIENCPKPLTDKEFYSLCK